MNISYLKEHAFFRLLSYLTPYTRKFILAILFMMATALFNNLSIYPIIPIVDNVFLHKYNPAPYQVPMIGVTLHFKAATLLISISFAWIILIFMKGLFSYLQSYIMLFIGSRMLYDLRNRLYANMIYLPLSYYTDTGAGQLISRLLAESIYIYNGIYLILAEMIRQPLTLVGYLIFLFILHWKMALFSICVLPLVTIVISYLGKSMHNYARKRQEKIGTLTEILHETIRGIRIVKGFHMEEYEKNRFDIENRKYFDNLLGTEKIVILSGPVVEFLGAGIGIGMILVYGGYEVLHNALTTGKYFAFVAVCLSTYKPLKVLTQTYNRFQESTASLERLFEIMDAKAEVSMPSGEDRVCFDRSIKFEHVSFKYEDKTILDDITFEIPKGSVTAIVGASGVGKTTLLNLLPRFYEVSSGKITIDDRDIVYYNLGTIRDAISLVTQETVLFSDTILNNIAYGKPDIQKQDVIAAAKIANADGFVCALTNGYNTHIGESGFKISGGQRQRIAIARAVLKNAPILILDEATSALDSESEKMVQEALSRLMEGRTTLIVAHRLSTVIDADKIVLLHKGRVDAIGTHNELMNSNEHYQKLYKMQFEKETNGK